MGTELVMGTELTIGRVKLPCGCDARKDIMFDKGNPGKGEVIIVTVALVMFGAAVIYNRRTGA